MPFRQRISHFGTIFKQLNKKYASVFMMAFLSQERHYQL